MRRLGLDHSCLLTILQRQFHFKDDTDELHEEISVYKDMSILQIEDKDTLSRQH